MSDELVGLATRLIGFDSSQPDGVLEAAGFVEGWLEARGISVATEEVRGLPVLKAPGAKLKEVRERAVAQDVGVIGMPTHAHQTTDYEAFKRMLKDTPAPNSSAPAKP